MKESVAVAKEADAKKGVSPTKSDNSILRLRNEPERQLGSLRGVIANITRNGGTPSVESIATQLSGMSTGGRAPALLALQQTHGNRYVQRVVAGIQAKLVVGQPGDMYEQEADRVAAQVVKQLHEPTPDFRAGTQSEALQTKMVVQGNLSGNAADVQPAVESAIVRTRGSGQPLSKDERDPLERVFGVDFSRVRLHADNTSNWLNNSLQARAFTIGQDIFVKRNEYEPGTMQGSELLAHELTHVVQQTGAANPFRAEEGHYQGTVRNLSRSNVVQRSPDDGSYNVGWELTCRRYVEHRRRAANQYNIRNTTPADMPVIGRFYMRPRYTEPLPEGNQENISVGANRPFPVSGPVNVGSCQHPAGLSGLAHGTILFRPREGSRNQRREVQMSMEGPYGTIEDNEIIRANIVVTGQEIVQQGGSSRSLERTTVGMERESESSMQFLESITDEQQNQVASNICQSITSTAHTAIESAIQNFDSQRVQLEAEAGASGDVSVLGRAFLDAAATVALRGLPQIDLGDLLGTLIGRGGLVERILNLTVGQGVGIILSLIEDAGAEAQAGAGAEAQAGARIGIVAQINGAFENVDSHLQEMRQQSSTEHTVVGSIQNSWQQRVTRALSTARQYAERERLQTGRVTVRETEVERPSEERYSVDVGASLSIPSNIEIIRGIEEPEQE